ncbi:XrtB/PEP-CTERM-associated polysaccharide biosynthesis outer membrane protein EpsL [Xylophilus sp. GOD-11R]|uniref:XrtB/PEP-CTERM-associated polysaccharide biosynthesis outer membrane protein EpsL n=1 Tax=Xylophilus sp. GOD-11R TaxID=3089814 RepID=UPI00298CFE16|nr:XrtB/PEP-CTERM-associated polysaccharide biosynthesis outer membrane protein EpsL [Xylophilus sp. GOD-11R]WPB57920.1 outer membrane beta-barrel protein [Xylophilus sp. GOD-11R]
MKKISGWIFSAHCIPIFLVATGARANPNDALQLSASYSISHTDNLFLLSKSRDAQALIGRSSAAETIHATTAGLNFDKDYGLQNVKLNVNAVNYDYKNFGYLGFTALNYTGTFGWSLTPRFRGSVFADRQENLSGFNDFRNYTVRNKRIATTTRAQGLYELDGTWQVIGSVYRQEVKNSATIIEQRAFSTDSVDAGLKKVFPSGSEIVYTIRRGSGDYSDASFATQLFLPSSYTETENQLNVRWFLSAKTLLNARVSYLQKNFGNYDFRDYSGLNASSTLFWSVSPRVDLAITLSRQIADYQTVYSSYVESDRIAFAPSWQIKEKLKLIFNQEFSHRNFKGATPVGATNVQRSDHLNLTRLSIEWEPREKMQLSAWFQRNNRSTNFTGFDFNARTIGLLAQISF